MPKPSSSDLSRRERQIMDVIYKMGEASAQDVHEGIPDAPSYSAVRALLVILEDKGHLKHERRGRKYIYRPTVARNKAKRHALRELMSTFFDNSAENLVASLLDPDDSDLSKSEIARIRKLITDKKRARTGSS